MKYDCNADPPAMGSPKGQVKNIFGPPSGWMSPGTGSDTVKGK